VEVFGRVGGGVNDRLVLTRNRARGVASGGGWAAVSICRPDGEPVGCATIDEHVSDAVPGGCGHLRGAGRVAYFIEMPAGRGFGALQLNALMWNGLST
jgi:hypothetical protein